MKQYCAQLLLLLGVVLCTHSWAWGEVTLQARLNRTEAIVGERVELIVVAQGTQALDSPISVSAIPGLAISYRGSLGTSQSVNILNGQMSQSIESRESFEVIPQEPGEYTISTISAVAGGHTVHAPPITLRVVKERAQFAARPEFFMETVASTLEPYEGQQVVLETWLYWDQTKDVQIVNETFQAFGRHQSEIQGAWSQGEPPLSGGQYTGPGSLPGKQAEFGGRIYEARQVWRTVAYPLHQGQVIVPAIESIVGIPQRQHQDPFFSPFFNQQRIQGVQVSTNSVILDVKPLPVEGKPERYTGLVGETSVSASVDYTEVPAHESMRLTVEVRSLANLKNYNELVLPLLEEFDVYDPITKAQTVWLSGEHYSQVTQKVWEYTLIPRNEGSVTIGSVRIPYFDPSTGQYRVAQSQPIPVMVTEGKRSAEARGFVMSSGERKRLIPIGEDFRHIVTTNQIYNQGPLLTSSPRAVLVLVFPWLFLAGVSSWRAHTQRLVRDPVGAKRRQAFRQAFKRMSPLQKDMNTLEIGEFYAQTERVVIDYLSNRFNLNALGMPISRLKEALAERQVPSTTNNAVGEFLETCQSARYQPGGGELAQRLAIMQQLKDLLAELETHS